MGRLQANYNLNKNNKISIKKQNLGEGKLSLKRNFPFAPDFVCVSNAGDARVLEQLYTKFPYINGSIWYVSMPSQQNFIFAPGSNSVTWELWTNTPSNVKIYTNPSTNRDIFPLGGWVSVDPSSDPVPTFTYNICP